MHPGGQPVGPLFPFLRRVVRCHPWLSGALLMSYQQSRVPEEPRFFIDQFRHRGRFVGKCSILPSSVELRVSRICAADVCDFHPVVGNHSREVYRAHT
jgi:hypothetical protein